MNILLKKIIGVLLAGTAIFSIYANVFSLWNPLIIRGGYWGLIAVIVFLTRKDITKNRWLPVDVALAVLAALCTIMLFVRWQAFASGIHDATSLETAIAVAMVIIVFEATRRTIGWFLGGMTLVFILYGLFGNYAPGLFISKSYSIARLTTFLFWDTKGIYGLPMYIAASYVMLFVIFGSFLLKSGGEKWFMDLSFAAVGRIKGGPALTSVISSALFGMMSGSPVANVVTTGSFTIPLMKQIGFKPHIAASIEAVASTAGMFTPPIMGAAAFIMAEYAEVPYIRIVMIAAVPALLFYLSLMTTVYLRAGRTQISVIDRDKIPNILNTLKVYGHLIPPIFILLFLLVMGWSLMWSAFWAIVSLLALATCKKISRMSLTEIIDALADATQKSIPVAVACAAAGIIYGVISLTGLGFRMTSILLALADGNKFLVLFFSMASGILLGFAMPPTAAYIILAALVVPTFNEVGIPLLVGHMFLFFFCSIGPITPPVALAAYSASGIAQSDPNRTGFAAFRFGLAAFIIPFLFVYKPQLLLIGSPISIILEIARAIGVLLCLAFFIEGFCLVKLNHARRFVFAGIVCTLLYPEPNVNIVGALFLVAYILLDLKCIWKKEKECILR